MWKNNIFRILAFDSVDLDNALHKKDNRIKEGIRFESGKIQMRAIEEQKGELQ